MCDPWTDFQWLISCVAFCVHCCLGLLPWGMIWAEEPVKTIFITHYWWNPKQEAMLLSAFPCDNNSNVVSFFSSRNNNFQKVSYFFLFWVLLPTSHMRNDFSGRAFEDYIHHPKLMSNCFITLPFHWEHQLIRIVSLPGTMSAHLNWLIIRDNNAHLLKRRNIKKPFSTVSKRLPPFDPLERLPDDAWIHNDIW